MRYQSVNAKVSVVNSPKAPILALNIFCPWSVLQTLNLLKAGNSVTVWNRSPGKTADVETAGAKVSPADTLKLYTGELQS